MNKDESIVLFSGGEARKKRRKTEMGVCGRYLGGKAPPLRKGHPYIKHWREFQGTQPMAATILLAAFASVLSGFRPPPSSGHESLGGNWLGEFKLRDALTPLKVSFKSDKPGVHGTADVPSLGVKGLALKRVSVKAPRVAFDLVTESGTLTFDGKWKADAISGEVRRGDLRGTFRLVRLATLDPKLLPEYHGVYRAGPNRLVTVSRFGEVDADAFFVDSKSGRCGPLYPLSETSFFSGPALVAPVFPVDVRVSFVKDGRGKVTGLTYRRGKAPAVSATRIPLKQEEVAFRNGPVKLAGTLTTPPGKGPHPAVILIHGSGPEDRHFLAPWAYFFAGHALATLAYDKRGVGASTGDWKRAGFEDLAGDVRAAIGLLADRKEIDRKQIGLWGVSQGGWVAPLVASRPPKDVAFIILHAGAAVTPARQGLLNVGAEMRAYGFPDGEIKEAIAYYKLNDDVTRTGKGWERLQEAYKKAKARKAEWLLEEPQPKGSWFRQFYRRIMDFDPSPYWEKVTCPVLAFLGERDRQVPPEANKKILDEALARARNKDYTVMVLPKANHLFLQAETGTRTEYSSLKEFVPGYFDAMGKWLLKRVQIR
jgi:pimeloyl-ACP methyl ester carboxylesterase